ncbi:hypothetical protein GDO78_022941 [Eleutherodactylus coqui]|uniref:Uncharacterized protein n=1 Tax=Eleutherodactylus coqui TaxID=57060 RepID=A0A8J6E9D6_ELECQ|nr:hypothetical protein GDO78_022941 [Eleutherodactylus coqui]
MQTAARNVARQTNCSMSYFCAGLAQIRHSPGRRLWSAHAPAARQPHMTEPGPPGAGEYVLVSAGARVGSRGENSRRRIRPARLQAALQGQLSTFCIM